MHKAQDGNTPPQERGPISRKFAIARLDLGTNTVAEQIPVLASLNGRPVTEDMVRRDVAALNRHAGLNGLTCKPIERTSAYRMDALH